MSIALYSPTVLYSYRIDDNWWYANGGNHPDAKHGYDFEGCDEYGYDSWGRDRDWKTKKDYERNPELFQEVKNRYNFLIKQLGRY